MVQEKSSISTELESAASSEEQSVSSVNLLQKLLPKYKTSMEYCFWEINRSQARKAKRHSCPIFKIKMVSSPFFLPIHILVGNYGWLNTAEVLQLAVYEVFNFHTAKYWYTHAFVTS